MSDSSAPVSGKTCQVKTLPLCTPEDLAPLLEALRENRPVPESLVFPRGTLLPDGRLDLCKQALGPDGTRLVTRALQGNQQVKNLLMGADQMGPEGAFAVAELLSQGSALRTVFLGCNAIGPAGANALCRALETNSTVQGLWLKRNQLGPEGARALAALLRCSTTLRTLDLVTNDLGVEGVAELVDALCAARGPLEILYLCGNRLGAGGALHLARLLKAQTPLRALYLAANQLGDEGAQILAESLRGARPLEALGLASNAIGPVGVAALCEALEAGAEVETLDLGFAPATEVLDAEANHLGDAGARRLAQMLRRVKTLRSLDLSRAEIGPEGARFLVDALEENTSLVRLKLGIPLTPELEQTRLALLCRNASRPQPLRPDVADIRSVYRTASSPRSVSSRPATAAPLVERPGAIPVQESTHGFSAEELALAKKVLHAISLRRSLITEGGAEIDELRRLAARIVRQERTEQKRSPKSRRSGRQNDLGLLAKTGMRRLRRARSLNKPVPVLEPAPEAPASLEKARRCYICKQHFRELHFFYDSLCPSCAALNFRKRSFSVDLSQRRAVVTGGRIKIGFQVALKLLRAGAEVLVTTRFPRDAAQRYAAEADFAQFAPRLSIVGLDLRDLRAVERFCQQLPAHWPHLDILINNAAQTVRKPEGFYAHLSAREQSPREALPEPVRALFPAVFLENSSLESARAPLSTREAERRLLQQETKGANPVEVLSAQEARDEEKILSAVRDEHQQPLDLRETNSWRLRLAEVETPELVEVHLINAFAPFLLNRGIKPLLLRSPFRDRYIVNVSAMEGQFYKLYKGPNHPHTNMAKAALNMMTLTSASDYAESGIYMTAVDTGWITDENPFVISTMMAANGFEPPLDEVDAAARIVDPVFVGASGGPRSVGEFLKDYAPTPW